MQDTTTEYQQTAPMSVDFRGFRLNCVAKPGRLSVAEARLVRFLMHSGRVQSGNRPVRGPGGESARFYSDQLRKLLGFVRANAHLITQGPSKLGSFHYIWKPHPNPVPYVSVEQRRAATKARFKAKAKRPLREQDLKFLVALYKARARRERNEKKRNQHWARYYMYRNVLRDKEREASDTRKEIEGAEPHS